MANNSYIHFLNIIIQVYIISLCYYLKKERKKKERKKERKKKKK